MVVLDGSIMDTHTCIFTIATLIEFRAKMKGIEGLDKDGVEAAVDFLHASSE